jgi:hypothetical protein
MRVIYFDNSVHQIIMCCDKLWAWVNGGMLQIITHADQEKCFAMLQTTEEGEAISWCPFCGVQIGFTQE